MLYLGKSKQCVLDLSLQILPINLAILLTFHCGCKGGEIFLCLTTECVTKLNFKERAICL